MKGMERERYKYLADVLKAIAHPSRILIVESLRDKEQCVCELTELVGSDMSTVSKHLSVLKRVGIVSSEKRGLKVFYKLEYPCVLDFTSCMQRIVESNAKKQLSVFYK